MQEMKETQDNTWVGKIPLGKKWHLTPLVRMTGAMDMHVIQAGPQSLPRIQIY